MSARFKFVLEDTDESITLEVTYDRLKDLECAVTKLMKYCRSHRNRPECIKELADTLFKDCAEHGEVRRTDDD